MPAGLTRFPISRYGFDRRARGSTNHGLQCSALEAKDVQDDQELRKVSLEFVDGIVKARGHLEVPTLQKFIRTLRLLRPVIEMALSDYTISEEIRDLLQEFSLVNANLLEKDPLSAAESGGSLQKAQSDDDDEIMGEYSQNLTQTILMNENWL